MHSTLLRHGILIVEHWRGLEQLAGPQFWQASRAPAPLEVVARRHGLKATAGDYGVKAGQLL